jgi:7-cyano-7-deazaguanine synthase in queuosine biosynthesis
MLKVIVYYIIDYGCGVCKKCTSRQIFFLNFGDTAVHKQQNNGNAPPNVLGFVV